MNISQLTSTTNITKNELDGVKARQIGADADGTTYLVHMITAEQTSSAMVYVPEDSERGEFICAGKTGPWMRKAAEDYIMERNSMLSENDNAVVGQTATEVSEEVYTTAFLAEYKIVAHPNGELSMRQSHDGFDLEITNDAWIKEAVVNTCPSVSDREWTVSRVDHQGGLESGSVEVLVGSFLERAIAGGAMLTDFKISEREETEMFVTDLEELSQIVGWMPEVGYYDDVRTKVAPEIIEFDYENDSTQMTMGF